MTTTNETIELSDLPNWVGRHLGHGEWREMTQDRVNQFADATDDHQFIHVDVERAKETPFGGTIAHGFLTLSLIVPIMGELFKVSGVKMGVN
jgi:acyl dehydratase